MIHPSLKTWGKISPWQTLQVTALPMEAKNKMTNQTKGRRPTQTPQAQAIRKGSSPKSLLTIMQCKGMSPARSSRGRSVGTSSKELV